jgi:hypothetical protein
LIKQVVSKGLKSGLLNYGGGQLARYVGGAGFQGNPFASGGAFTFWFSKQV